MGTTRRLRPGHAVRLHRRLRHLAVSPPAIFNLIRTRSLALPRHLELVDELLHVRLRPNAYGVMRVDHDAGRHDDHVIALGLATLDLQLRTSAFTDYLAALAADPPAAATEHEVDRPALSPAAAAAAGCRRGVP